MKHPYRAEALDAARRVYGQQILEPVGLQEARV
jgi:hypothetical protein